MAQVLQRRRLNQVAVYHLDTQMCFQLKFWSWYNAIMKSKKISNDQELKTTFTAWKLHKALDIESYRCTAGSLLSLKPEWKDMLITF